jgi:hypothetical protein
LKVRNENIWPMSVQKIRTGALTIAAGAGISATPAVACIFPVDNRKNREEAGWASGMPSCFFPVLTGRTGPPRGPANQPGALLRGIAAAPETCPGDAAP